MFICDLFEYNVVAHISTAIVIICTVRILYFEILWYLVVTKQFHPLLLSTYPNVEHAK